MVARADTGASWRNGARRTLAETLESLIDSFEVVRDLLHPALGGCEIAERPALVLKGSLAGAAILGASLRERFGQGVDLDLHIERGSWVPQSISWSEWAQLTGMATALWVLAQQRGRSPREALVKASHAELDAIMRRFFAARVCLDGSMHLGSWTLYRVNLVHEGGINHLDVAGIYRLGRPYLSDDSSVEVILPLAGQEVRAFSWVAPRVVTQRLAQREFDIPGLEQIERGAFEKVLIRQAKGMRYVGGLSNAPALVEHFQRSCEGGQGRSWWEIACQRLADQMEHLEQPWERLLIHLQLMQLFPLEKPLPGWEDAKIWPEALLPLRDLLQELPAEQRSLWIVGLSGWINGWLARQSLTPLPLWREVPMGFVAAWGEQGMTGKARQLLEAIGAFNEPPVASPELDPRYVWAWLEGWMSGSLPAEDGRLVLGFLGTVAAQIPESACWAARILLEQPRCEGLESLLKPWPSLRARVEPWVRRVHHRQLLRASPLERRAMWLDALVDWPELLSLVEKVPEQELHAARRQRALWDGLTALWRRREALPLPICQQVAAGDWPEPAREQDGDLLHALVCEGGQIGPKIVAWMGAGLKRPVAERSVTAEARAWLSLLAAQQPIRSSLLRQLWDAALSSRWGLASGPMQEGILKTLSASSDQSGELDERWELLIHCARSHPQAWEQIAQLDLLRLTPARATEHCRISWQTGRWSLSENALLHKLLSDDRTRETVSALAVREGWPLEAVWQWRQLMQELQAVKEPRQAIALLDRCQHMGSDEEGPPEDVIVSLVDWIAAQQGWWVSSRKPKSGLSLAAGLQGLAVRARQSWGCLALEEGLLDIWWLRAARDAPESLQAPWGVDGPTWWRAALQRSLRCESWAGFEQRVDQWAPLVPEAAQSWLTELMTTDLPLAKRAAAWPLAERRQLCVSLGAADWPMARWAQVASFGALGTYLRADEPVRSRWLLLWEPLLRDSLGTVMRSQWLQEALPWVGQEARGEGSTALLMMVREQILAELMERAVPQLVQVDLAACDQDPLLFFGDPSELETQFWRGLVQSALILRVDRIPPPMESIQRLTLAMLIGKLVRQMPVQALAAEASVVEPGLLSWVYIQALALQKDTALQTGNAEPLVRLVLQAKDALEQIKREPQADRFALVQNLLGACVYALGTGDRARWLQSPAWETLPAWLPLLHNQEIEPGMRQPLEALQAILLAAFEKKIAPPSPFDPLWLREHGRAPLVALGSLHLSLSHDPDSLTSVCESIERMRFLAEVRPELMEIAIFQQVLITLEMASWGNRTQDPRSWDDPAIWPASRFALATISGFHEVTQRQVLNALLRALSGPVAEQHPQRAVLWLITSAWASCLRDKELVEGLLAGWQPDAAALEPIVEAADAWWTWDAAFGAVADIEMRALEEAKEGQGPAWPSALKPHRLLERVLLEVGRHAVQEASGRASWMRLVEQLASRPPAQIREGQVTQVREGIVLCALIRIQKQLEELYPALAQSGESPSAGASKTMLPFLLDRLLELENQLGARAAQFLLNVLMESLRTLPARAARGSVRGRSAAGASQHEQSAPLLPEQLWVDQVGRRLLAVASVNRLITIYSCMLVARSAGTWEGQASEAFDEWQKRLADRIQQHHGELFLAHEIALRDSPAATEHAREALRELVRHILEVPILDRFLFLTACRIGALLGQGRQSNEDLALLDQLSEQIASDLHTFTPCPEDYSALLAAASINHIRIRRLVMDWWAQSQLIRHRAPDLDEYERARSRCCVAIALTSAGVIEAPHVQTVHQSTDLLDAGDPPQPFHSAP